MSDEPRRTVRVKLDMPTECRGNLHQTKTQFFHCANRTSEWAWRYDDYCVTNKSTAEGALYDELREETDLTANLVQKGIRRAIEVARTCASLLISQNFVLAKPSQLVWRS